MTKRKKSKTKVSAALREARKDFAADPVPIYKWKPAFSQAKLDQMRSEMDTMIVDVGTITVADLARNPLAVQDQASTNFFNALSVLAEIWSAEGDKTEADDYVMQAALDHMLEAMSYDGGWHSEKCIITRRAN